MSKLRYSWVFILVLCWMASYVYKTMQIDERDALVKSLEIEVAVLREREHVDQTNTGYRVDGYTDTPVTAPPVEINIGDVTAPTTITVGARRQQILEEFMASPVDQPDLGLPEGHVFVAQRQQIDYEWVLIAVDTMSALQGVRITFTDPEGVLSTETVTSDAAGRISVPEAYRSILRYEGQSGDGCWTSNRKVQKVLTVDPARYPVFTTESGYQEGTDGVMRRGFFVQ